MKMNRNPKVRTPTQGRSPRRQKDLIYERGFQKLIEKWDSDMDVVVSAGIMDTGREIAKTVSSVVVHSVSKMIVRF